MSRTEKDAPSASRTEKALEAARAAEDSARAALAKALDAVEDAEKALDLADADQASKLNEAVQVARAVQRAFARALERATAHVTECIADQKTARLQALTSSYDAAAVRTAFAREAKAYEAARRTFEARRDKMHADMAALASAQRAALGEAYGLAAELGVEAPDGEEIHGVEWEWALGAARVADTMTTADCCALLTSWCASSGAPSALSGATFHPAPPHVSAARHEKFGNVHTPQEWLEIFLQGRKAVSAEIARIEAGIKTKQASLLEEYRSDAMKALDKLAKARFETMAEAEADSMFCELKAKIATERDDYVLSNMRWEMERAQENARGGEKYNSFGRA